MKIALFGGSFDPIHRGHLACAQAVYDALNLDELIFMPTYLSPHKKDSFFNPQQRYALIKSSLSSLNIKASVSSFEINKKGPSWTIDTVFHIKKKYPNAELYFCCGADLLETILRWKRSSELAKLMTFVCYPRGDLRPIYPNGFNVIHLDEKIWAISSTDIKSKLIKQMDVSEDLPVDILGMIKEFNDVNRLNG